MKRLKIGWLHPEGHVFFEIGSGWLLQPLEWEVTVAGLLANNNFGILDQQNMCFLHDANQLSLPKGLLWPMAYYIKVKKTSNTASLLTHFPRILVNTFVISTGAL